jgi:hypothetical protein
MLQLRPQETLDGGDHGWLKARHHFVVSADGSPANGPLGAPVVWDDDEITPGAGFGRHRLALPWSWVAASYLSPASGLAPPPPPSRCFAL